MLLIDYPARGNPYNSVGSTDSVIKLPGKSAWVIVGRGEDVCVNIKLMIKVDDDSMLPFMSVKLPLLRGTIVNRTKYRYYGGP